MIFLGADHGGFPLKERVKVWLRGQGWSVVDLGARRLRPTDDYPLIARRVALAVRRRTGGRGILLCRSGIGMAMVANKVRGVRAVQALSPAVVVRSRREEATNVLALAADWTSLTAAKRLIARWLATPFRPLARYRRRLRQVDRLHPGV